MTSAAPHTIALETLHQMHPRATTEPYSIRRFVSQLLRDRIPVHGAPDTVTKSCAWTVTSIGGDCFTLAPRGSKPVQGGQLLLSTNVDGRTFFFSAPVLDAATPGVLRAGLPGVVYRAERRDRVRHAPEGADSTRAALHLVDRSALTEIVDYSADGFGLRVPTGVHVSSHLPTRMRFLNGTRAGQTAWVRRRNTCGPSSSPEWERIGVTVMPGERYQRVARRGLVAESCPPRTVVSASLPREPWIEDFSTPSGHRIRAIVDSYGSADGAPIVLIPPAWGRTKETLLPLAATLIATFADANEPVVIVRFDGIRKRGESYNDPECSVPGNENLNYTFSQGALDIGSVLHAIEERPWDSRRVALVTFSVASIEGRRAIAEDGGKHVRGWISTVGASDAQSLVRSISGGIDYLGGAELGLRFGHQGVQGLMLDIDHAADDAIRQGLAFLADAREDAASIDIPITWIHGQDDAWLDVRRAEDMLSCGNTSERQIVEAPTGHQLKTSSDAAQVFRYIASECARMLLGRELAPVAPREDELRARKRAEYRRAARAHVDLNEFWRDYLVGRGSGIGMEVVTHTAAYRNLMSDQIAALGDLNGSRVVDLGCGIGSFAAALAEWAAGPGELELVEVDFVIQGLLRARQRMASIPIPRRWTTSFVVGNLNACGSDFGLPLSRASADAVLASLLVNYVQDGNALLQSIFELLKPGGRIVVSGLKRDADTSRICVGGLAELRAGAGLAAFGVSGERTMETAVSEFINDSGRLLDLEERGWFQFWDAAEMEAMARRAGFEDIRIVPSFGKPAQAWVLSGRRPRLA